MLLLYVVAAVLFALDAATTVYGLTAYPGKIVEGNAVAADLMTRARPAVVMTLAKLALLAWLYFVAQPPAWALCVIIAGYAALAAWNARVIVRAARN